MKSDKEKNIVYVRLDKGEEIFGSLYEIIEQYNIKSGWINGLGAVNNVVMGSYDPENKNYNKINFNEDYELTSLIGNVSTKDNKPFLHIHVNISNQKCQAFGGHLFSGDIIATGEIKIFITDTEINRSYNDETGLYLWDFEHCES